jgi:hypothetical protein
LQYSYELLLQYLQKTQALVMLGIINERIIFEGTVAQSIENVSSNFTSSHFSNLLCHISLWYIGSICWATFIDL